MGEGQGTPPEESEGLRRGLGRAVEVTLSVGLVLLAWTSFLGGDLDEVVVAGMKESARASSVVGGVEESRIVSRGEAVPAPEIGDEEEVVVVRRELYMAVEAGLGAVSLERDLVWLLCRCERSRNLPKGRIGLDRRTRRLVAKRFRDIYGGSLA